MSLSKSRLLASGLAVAGVAGAVALGFAAPHLSRGLLPGGANQAALGGGKASTAGGPVSVAEKAADKQKDGAARGESGSRVHVAAPSTSVNVDKDRGKVRVTAPHTDVRVDPDEGRVQVRAPYVNLDIRW
jgi:hypothetical protein